MISLKLHRIVDIIINRRKLIEKIFAVLVVLSLLAVPFVNVNYDLSKYLPKSAPSKQGLSVMEDEFGYPGIARVMIKDVSIYEAQLYKDKIENVEGVDMVMWADSITDIYQSSQFIQYKDIDDYYKDGYTIMDVTFVEGASSPLTRRALDEIKDITGNKGYYGGPAVQNKYLSEALFREGVVAMVIAVFAIAIILCLTTTSWFEPVLFLTVMGIAVIINMGSNIFLGTISFLSSSVAAVLQLAMAMDYSIFLLHSFTREKSTGLPKEKAMANAIRSSASSILSSGTTTIVGFIVMVYMHFTIGRDIGIVLAKGILISLFVVMFMMPALILRWSGKIEKAAHRSFMPSFRHFGEKIHQTRFITLVLIVIAVIPAYVAQSMNSFTYGNSAFGSSEGTVVREHEMAMNTQFGRSNLVLALVPNTDPVTEKELSEELTSLLYINYVTSLANTLPEGVPESTLPKSISSKLHTKNYARILISIKTADESELAFSACDEINAIVKKYYPENSYIAGETPSTQDIKNIIVDDYEKVNILSILGVMLAIMITFKSFIIPLVVVIPIEIAIFLSMSLSYVFGNTLLYMGYIIVSCLQLGATVDYSILLTSNYLANRKQLEKKEAVISAISSSALSILTSGTILTVVGYGLYFTSSISAISDLGQLIGRGALFSMTMVLCLLPALLVTVDKLIFKQKKHFHLPGRLRKMQHRKADLDI